MRILLPSAVAIVMLAGPGSAATVQSADVRSPVMPPLPLAAAPVGGLLADELIFDAPETPPMIDEPATNCAADGPGCPQIAPPPGGHDGVGQVPLPPAIVALLAGLAALVGLRRRPRPV
jgi:hypothetical protein